MELQFEPVWKPMFVPLSQRGWGVEGSENMLEFGVTINIEYIDFVEKTKCYKDI